MCFSSNAGADCHCIVLAKLTMASLLYAVHNPFNLQFTCGRINVKLHSMILSATLRKRATRGSANGHCLDRHLAKYRCNEHFLVEPAPGSLFLDLRPAASGNASVSVGIRWFCPFRASATATAWHSESFLTRVYPMMPIRGTVRALNSHSAFFQWP